MIPLMRIVGLTSALIAGAYFVPSWKTEGDISNFTASPMPAPLTQEGEPVLASRVYTHIPWFSLADYVRTADTIVLGEISSVRSDVTEDVVPYQEYGLNVLESWKGIAQERVHIRVTGGKAGDVQVIVEDAPAFQVGERAVFFLERSAQGWHGILGLRQGVYMFEHGSSGEALIGLHAEAGESPSELRKRIALALGRVEGRSHR